MVQMQQNQFKTIFTSIIEQCTLENEVQRLDVYKRQLALRGKAFGFSVLQEHAVMTPVIRIFFVMLIVRYLSDVYKRQIQIIVILSSCEQK